MAVPTPRPRGKDTLTPRVDGAVQKARAGGGTNELVQVFRELTRGGASAGLRSEVLVHRAVVGLGDRPELLDAVAHEVLDPASRGVLLQRAAMQGHVETVRWLVDGHVPKDAEDYEFGALWNGAGRGHFEVVAFLAARLDLAATLQKAKDERGWFLFDALARHAPMGLLADALAGVPPEKAMHARAVVAAHSMAKTLSETLPTEQPRASAVRF